MEGIEATSYLETENGLVHLPVVLQKEYIESYESATEGAWVTMRTGKRHFIQNKDGESAYERLKQAMGPISVRSLWSDSPRGSAQWKDRV